MKNKIIIFSISIIINLSGSSYAKASSAQTATDRAQMYADFFRNRNLISNENNEVSTSLVNEFNNYQQELTQAKSSFNQAEFAALQNFIVNIDQFKAGHAENLPNLKDETLNDFITLQAQLADKYRNSNNSLLKAQVDNTLNLINSVISELFSDVSKTKNISELASFQMPEHLTSDSLFVTNRSINNLISIRINEGIGFGVPSGDETERYGSWIKAFYTSAAQKSFKFTSAYQLNQTGMILGFDAGEDSKIGAAYSFVNSNIKGKSFSSKEDTRDHFGSIYGLLVVSDNLFVSGQLSYGIIDIKKQRKNDDTNHTIANGKTKANTLNVQALAGYNFRLGDSNSIIIPTIGLESTQCNIKGYKETGNGLNRNINKRKAAKTSIISGLINKYEIDMRHYKLVPDIHANINYAINDKNDSTKITVADNTLPIAIPSSELSKFTYNLGTALKLSYKALNFEIGYDFILAKKFISNTVSLKLRADF